MPDIPCAVADTGVHLADVPTRVLADSRIYSRIPAYWIYLIFYNISDAYVVLRLCKNIHVILFN